MLEWAFADLGRSTDRYAKSNSPPVALRIRVLRDRIPGALVLFLDKKANHRADKLSGNPKGE